MSSSRHAEISHFVRALEDFNALFIGLPGPAPFSLSALSIVHTLSRRGPLRITDLVALEQIKQPAVTAAVKRLERDGFVRRRPHPRDRRVSLIELTSEGQRLVQARHEGRVAGLAALLDEHSTHAERAILLRATRVLESLAETTHPRTQ